MKIAIWKALPCGGGVEDLGAFTTEEARVWMIENGMVEDGNGLPAGCAPFYDEDEMEEMLIYIALSETDKSYTLVDPVTAETYVLHLTAVPDE